VRLSEADQRAVDALIDAGFDAGKVDPVHRSRAARALDLLASLDHPASAADDDGLLIAATLAVVDRARRSESMELSPRDEDALDALVAAGMDTRRVPSALRARAARQAELLGGLDLPIGDADRSALIARTTLYVRAQAEVRSASMRIGPPPEGSSAERAGGLRIRWADLVAVAALLTLSTAVIAPMLGAVRGHQQRAACSANMAAAGVGFGAYAADFRDALPLASSSPAGHPWWNVGEVDKSNSANLYTMLRTRHVRAESLACAGNPHACRDAPGDRDRDWRSLDQVSYSYQNMFAAPAARPKWTQPSRVVVLADRSPVIPLAVQGRVINPLANSLNHAGRGQTVLFNDGSADWMRTPVMPGGDNIWLPREVEELVARLSEPTRAPALRGTEAPLGADDVFLGP
jgi:hypothetical protein